MNDRDEKAAQKKAERAAYQHAYYLRHKTKALAYQRAYNLKHKRPTRHRRGEKGFLAERPKLRDVYTASDIIHSPMGRTAIMVDQILSGARGLAL